MSWHASQAHDSLRLILTKYGIKSMDVDRKVRVSVCKCPYVHRSSIGTCNITIHRVTNVAYACCNLLLAGHNEILWCSTGLARV